MDVAGFSHQVGGHCGIFKCDGHVLKPLNTREFHFYKSMDERLIPFAPKYCGQISIRVNLSGVDVTLSTDASVECHSIHPTVSTTTATITTKSEAPLVNSTSANGGGTEDEDDTKSMTFRVRKSGRVEAEKALNTWAGQCQSKVSFLTQ